jgi:hypothetical protein
MSTFLQTALSTEAHLAEGEILLVYQILTIESSCYIEWKLEDQVFPKGKDRI